jgi:hypothetical protein
MKKLLSVFVLFYSALTFSAIPELPFPSGSCSGIFSLRNPEDWQKNSSHYDGNANFTLTLDFDEAQAYGVFLLFDDYDGENERFAEWSLDQDASGTSFTMERDELMPASFIATLSLELPVDDSTPNLVNLQPTGNVFQEYTIKLRLLPTGGGSMYIIQGINNAEHGFCAAL